jgi:hypothetical protein
MQRSRFNSRYYHMFWEVVSLERGPLSLSTIQELLGRKSSLSGLESREYGRRDPSRWPRGTFYPQKLALTSPTSGGRAVAIVRPRTNATEFVYCLHFYSESLDLRTMSIVRSSQSLETTNVLKAGDSKSPYTTVKGLWILASRLPEEKFPRG